jgi:hypothetical protein
MQRRASSTRGRPKLGSGSFRIPKAGVGNVCRQPVVELIVARLNPVWGDFLKSSTVIVLNKN